MFDIFKQTYPITYVIKGVITWMIIGSAKWFFEIREIPPIVIAYCTSDDKRILPVMLSMAADLMEAADKFNGVPFRVHNIPNVKATLMVSFTLIFKNTKDAVAYINELQNFK